MSQTPEQPTPREPSRRSRAARRRASELGRRTAQAFDTRTERWQEVGLSAEIERAGARRAWREAVLWLLLLAGILIAFAYRHDLFPGVGKPVRYITAGLLVVIGWGLARSAAKAVAPTLMRRLEPATAGTVGFLLRLLAIVVVVLASLAIAGVDPQTLAVGGALTAVVLGLAAQQTLGNVIAGATLISARPFRVADRLRIQGVGINLEGTVATLGLFHTTLISGGDRILIPNSVLMGVALIPVNEPEAVEVTARFADRSLTPAKLQEILLSRVSVPLVRPPEVELDEIGADRISTFSIVATPEAERDGAQLASDVIAAVVAIGGEGDTDPRGEPETPL